ncbi:MAG: polynucleotide adenylyltransferase, partial [Puniceicoccaceae bacterium]
SEHLKLQSSAPKPLIQGRDLIAHHLAPSPRFSAILSACYEAQLDGAFNDPDSAQVYLKSFLKKQKYI